MGRGVVAHILANSMYRTAGINQQSSIFNHPACFLSFSSIIMDVRSPELAKIGACDYDNESVTIVSTISKENLQN